MALHRNIEKEENKKEKNREYTENRLRCNITFDKKEVKEKAEGGKFK